MNDRQSSARPAPEPVETPETGPVPARGQAAAAEPPRTPLMMVSGEAAGFCTGDACELPVRNDRGEVQ